MKTYTHLNIFCDGGARGNPGRAAVGVVIKSENGTLAKFGKRIGEATNNVAEYRAVITALEYLRNEKISAHNIVFHLDSLLVARQLSNLYKVKEGHLRELLLGVRILEREVGGEITYQTIPRAQNHEADAQVNSALDQTV